MTRTFEEVIKKYFKGKEEKKLINSFVGPAPIRFYKVQIYIKATKKEQEETRKINPNIEDPAYRYFTELDSLEENPATPGQLETMLDSINYIKRDYKNNKKKFDINFYIITYGVNPVTGIRLDLDIDEKDIKEVHAFLKGAVFASSIYSIKVVDAT